MDVVLGLSITATSLRWVLVDGVSGTGDAEDRGVAEITDLATLDPDALLAPLLDGRSLHAVGIAWTAGAEEQTTKISAALTARGAQPVAVSQIEATKVLADGIAELAGEDFLVVCDTEPDATVVVTVNSRRMTAEQIDDADPIEQVAAVLREARPSPDIVFVLGSGDTDALAEVLRTETTRPVLTATEAQFALPRGVALVAARAAATPLTPNSSHKPRISLRRTVSRTAARRGPSSVARRVSPQVSRRVRAAAAAVIAVVGLGVAGGLIAHRGDTDRRTDVADHGVTQADSKPERRLNDPPVREPAAVPAPPEQLPAASPTPAGAPAPTAPGSGPPDAVPADHQLAPPVYQPPAYEPPAYQPPAYEPPAYQPPAYEPPAAPPPPVYVPPPPPPAAPPPPPRLRDRIKDKIPVLRHLG